MTFNTCSFQQAQYAYDNMSPPEDSDEGRYAEYLNELDNEAFLEVDDTESEVWQAEYDARVYSGEIKEWENGE